MKGVIMHKMKKCFLHILFSLVLSFPPFLLYGMDNHEHKSQSVKEAGAGQTAIYPAMPDPGKKVPLGNGYYLIYGFDKKPRMGMAIVKVEIFAAEGKKDNSFEVRADAGMPSMKGAHETGEQPFKLSQKGDYLLPINLVMPGGWEIRLVIIKDGKVLFRGRHNFDV
jgi:hypothetical protein